MTRTFGWLCIGLNVLAAADWYYGHNKTAMFVFVAAELCFVMAIYESVLNHYRGD